MKTQKQIDALNLQLMGLDASAVRNQLKDRVRGDGDALARKAHRFLTLAKEYNERKRLSEDGAEQHVPSDVLYQRRLDKLTRRLVTTQRRVGDDRKYPKAETDVRKYVARFSQENNLAECDYFEDRLAA